VGAVFNREIKCRGWDAASTKIYPIVYIPASSMLFIFATMIVISITSLLFTFFSDSVEPLPLDHPELIHITWNEY
jgi:hypothetical protein